MPDGTTRRPANRRVPCRPGRAVATSRPKLSTQPRPELRPQAGPEVLREPTSVSMLPRLCWCTARSIEAMHAPAVKLHHLAAQFHLTLLAPTAPSPAAFEIVHGADMVQITPAPEPESLHNTHTCCLPCLALDSATRPAFAPDEFSLPGLTLQVLFTSTPTAHYHRHHHRLRHPPTRSMKGPARPPSPSASSSSLAAAETPLLGRAEHFRFLYYNPAPSSIPCCP